MGLILFNVLDRLVGTERRERLIEQHHSSINVDTHSMNGPRYWVGLQRDIRITVHVYRSCFHPFDSRLIRQSVLRTSLYYKTGTQNNEPTCIVLVCTNVLK